MIGIDTNVLVRFLTQDDAAQGAIASDFMAGLHPNAPGYICREVIVELVWVLERAYKFGRGEIAHAVEGLLAAQDIVVEDETHVSIALARYAQGGAGFADQMIAQATQAAGCTHTVSFDRAASTTAGMRMLGQTDS